MKNLPPEVEARVIAAGEAALLAAGVHPSQAGEIARQGLALILAVSYELEVEVRAAVPTMQAAYEPDAVPLAPHKQAIHDTIEASYAAARAAEAAKAVERGWGSPESAVPEAAPSAYEVPEADHLKIADLPPPIEVATGYTLDDGRTPVVDPGLGIEVRPAPISSLDADQEAGTLAARRLITPAGTGDVSILDRPKDNEPE